MRMGALRQGRSVVIAFTHKPQSTVAARDTMARAGAKRLEAARQWRWFGPRPAEEKPDRDEALRAGRISASWCFRGESSVHGNPDRLGRRQCLQPLPRVHQAADEEDDSAARVADQEEERVIGAEDNGLFAHAHSGGMHGDAGGGGGLGSLL